MFVRSLRCLYGRFTRRGAKTLDQKKAKEGWRGRFVFLFLEGSWCGPAPFSELHQISAPYAIQGQKKIWISESYWMHRKCSCKDVETLFSWKATLRRWHVFQEEVMEEQIGRVFWMEESCLIFMGWDRTWGSHPNHASFVNLWTHLGQKHTF